MIILKSTHEKELEKYRKEIQRLRRINKKLKDKMVVMRDPKTGRFIKVD